MTSIPQLRLAFFASRNGSAMRAIHAAISADELEASIGVVISNNADALALTWARKQNLPAHHLSATKLGSPEALSEKTLEVLSDANITHIVLSGYMRKLSNQILKNYAGRILNVHPSLLLAFGGKGMYGDYVHEAVLNAGVNESGATIHLVTEDYDEGPILGQIRCEVLDTDDLKSLKSRVAPIEATLYISTLKQIEVNATST